jgi:hypothetical protein
MFDNIDPKLKENKVEDIFAGAETDANKIPPEEDDLPSSRFNFSGIDKTKIIYALGGVLILVFAIWAIVYALGKIAPIAKQVVDLNPATTTKEKAVVVPATTPENSIVEKKLPDEVDPQNIVAPKDSDGDGLSDDEEKKLGTNPNSPDSDNDGLTDREEVKVYGTNPLNADTDGDGYTDGAEVKGGYNPKGPGKLYQK